MELVSTHMATQFRHLPKHIPASQFPAGSRGIWVLGLTSMFADISARVSVAMVPRGFNAGYAQAIPLCSRI